MKRLLFGIIITLFVLTDLFSLNHTVSLRFQVGNEYGVYIYKYGEGLNERALPESVELSTLNSYIGLADYLLSTDKFKFRLIGGSSTETLRNTCEYIVQVIPTPTTYSSYTESSITSGNYIQLADTTSSQYNSSYSSMTSSAINGTEDVSLRKIQVPLISSGYNAQSNGSFYYFSYSADIGILLTGFEGTDNRTALQSGLYTSTIFITVISEL